MEIEKKKLLDESNPHFVMVIFNIAQAYDKIGDIENSEIYFQRAFKLNAKICSETHISTLQMKLLYAKFLKSHQK